MIYIQVLKRIHVHVPIDKIYTNCFMNKGDKTQKVLLEIDGQQNVHSYLGSRFQ